MGNHEDALRKIADMIDDENADLDDAIAIAEAALKDANSIFEISPGLELEAVSSGRPEWIIPDPAPRCKLAIRADTKEWFVATGAYYKALESIDGTLFRDHDGCTWRLIVVA